VVDDETAVRELTIRALDQAGFSCAGAIDGEQALQKLNDERFEAVVTDLHMPNLHGHALAVELLTRPERPLIFVVTGVGEPKLAKDLLARGVDDIFFKPVDHGMLVLKLEAFLARRQTVTATAE